MTKLLKAMVFVLLILGITALVFATLLFSKRELLTGRARKLENAIIAIGTTIEAEPAAGDIKPSYPAKDISEVTSEELDTPRLSSFWDSYEHDLELLDQPTLNVGKQRTELMLYYKVDPITGKPERDIQGLKITSGPGTMQGVLDDILGKSEEQLNRLNTTRQQLTDVRAELVATITELNDLKRSHRTALRKIEDLEAEIVQHKAEIASLKQDIAQLEEEKRGLEDQIAEQRRQIELLEDEKAERDLTIERLRADLKKFEDMISQPADSSGTGAMKAAAGTFTGQVDPGEKGHVLAVDAQWNFVVVELTDAFLGELLSDEDGGIPQLDLMIKRMAGGEETFVTKVRLIQVNKAEKRGICDILPDWQQLPVEQGDVVFF